MASNSPEVSMTGLMRANAKLCVLAERQDAAEAEGKGKRNTLLRLKKSGHVFQNLTPFFEIRLG